MPLFKKVKFKWWYLILLIAPFVIGMLKINILDFIFGKQETLNAKGVLEMMKSNLVYSLISATLIAPVLEEIIFREVIMNIAFKDNFWSGYIVSSIFFALIHIPTNLYSFINYFVIGLCFGAVYKITKSLAYATASHAINNFIAQVMIISGM